MSFLDGKYIHKSLLKLAFEDDFKFQEALRLLMSRSIIKCYTSRIPGNDPIDVVTIHDLYQTAVRKDQEQTGAVEDSLGIVLDLFFIEYPKTNH